MRRNHKKNAYHIAPRARSSPLVLRAENQELSHKFSGIKTWILPILFSFATTLYICWPSIGANWHHQIISGHDVGTHQARLQVFYEAWRAGQFPVRWVMWVRPGLDHELFQFYNSGWYYLASLGMWLGFPWWIATTLGLIFSTLLGWWGVWHWLEHLANSKKPSQENKIRAAQILTTTAFTVSTTRMLELSVRAAYPEYLALALVPWWWLAMLREKYATAALWFIAILLTHTPTAVLAVFGIGVQLTLHWGTLLWQQKISLPQLIKKMLICCASLGLSLAGTAWWWLPIPSLWQFVRPELLQSGYYNFQLHFLELPQFLPWGWGYGLSELGTQDQLGYHLGLLLTGSTVITTLWAGYQVLAAKKQTDPPDTTAPVYRNYWFWTLLILLVGSIWLSLSWSESFWLSFPFLAIFQYPWRWLGLALLAATGILFLGLVYWFENREKHTTATWIGILLLLGLQSWNARFPSTRLTIDQFDVATIRTLKQPELPTTFGLELGYFPTGQLPEKIPTTTLPKLSSVGEVKTLAQSPTKYAWGVKTDNPTTMTLPILSFPGWRLTVDGILVSNQPVGQYWKVEVPPGIHQVNLQLEKTTMQHLADWISLFGLCLVLVLAYTERKMLT